MLNSSTNMSTGSSVGEAIYNVKEGDILKSQSDNYFIKKRLGAGTYGIVVECVKIKTNKHVAVKVTREGYDIAGKTEVNILNRIRQLNPDKNNLQTFIEHFNDKNHFCMVTDLLYLSLYDFILRRNCKPMDVCEIRPIAQQILIALKALKSIGLVHTDIKPDNIMLVNHQAHPFKVKLIDFGLATTVPKLKNYVSFQNLSYRAPEVMLQHPSIDEKVDMWSLGCSLAFLFLGEELYPYDCEYEAMRMIVQMNGKPKNKFLDAGEATKCFFNLWDQGTKKIWCLKSPKEYRLKTGQNVTSYYGKSNCFYSLDQLQSMEKRPQNHPIKWEDTKAFISFLKHILVMNPKYRVTSAEALIHTFITMEHLTAMGKHPYVVRAENRMRMCPIDKQENMMSSSDSEEQIRKSFESDSKSDSKKSTADSWTTIDSTDSDKYSGNSEKQAVGVQIYEVSSSKEETSSPIAVTTDQQDFTKTLSLSSPIIDRQDSTTPLSVKTGTHEVSSSKEETSSPVAVTTDQQDFTKTLSLSSPIIDRQDSTTPLSVKTGTHEVSSNKEETSSPVAVTTDQQDFTKTLSLPSPIIDRQDSTTPLSVKTGTHEVSSSKEETSSPVAVTTDQQDFTKTLSLSSPIIDRQDSTTPLSVKTGTHEVSSNKEETSSPVAVTTDQQDFTKTLSLPSPIIDRQDSTTPLSVKTGTHEVSSSKEETSSPVAVTTDQQDFTKTLSLSSPIIDRQDSTTPLSVKTGTHEVSSSKEETSSPVAVTTDQQDFTKTLSVKTGTYEVSSSQEVESLLKNVTKEQKTESAMTHTRKLKGRIKLRIRVIKYELPLLADAAGCRCSTTKLPGDVMESIKRSASDCKDRQGEKVNNTTALGSNRIAEDISCEKEKTSNFAEVNILKKYFRRTVKFFSGLFKRGDKGNEGTLLPG